jgi:hypothetical protein
MTEMAFDTLAYAKHLEPAGVDRRQAEAHTEAMNQYLRPALATKAEFDALRQATKTDIAALEQRMDQRSTALEQSLRAKIKSAIAALEQRLQRLIHQTQVQTLGMMGAMLGILFALLRMAATWREASDRTSPRPTVHRGS